MFIDYRMYFVDNVADFRAAQSLPLLGVFTQGHMSQVLIGVYCEFTGMKVIC